MRYLALDSFELHNVPTPGKFLTHQPIQGLEFPLLRSTSFARSGQDGMFVAQQFFGERRINLSGVTYNITSLADLGVQRQAFLANNAPLKDSVGNILPRVLHMTLDDRRQVRISVQVMLATMPMDNMLYATWTLDLLAIDATISSEVLHTVVLNQYVGGGFVLPAILPITFGTGSGSTVSAPNAGDSPAYPVMTLAGPLTNPYVQNLTTGAYMSLTLAIAAGQSVVVDMANRTVILGGFTNRISAKAAGSTFWSLQPGANTLRLTTSVSGEGGSASVSYRDAYRGV
jgi:hypothetical protein